MNIDIMKILNIISGIILIPIMVSCISDRNVVENKCYPLAVSVEDDGFIPKNITKDTRTIDNRYTTTFAKGDKIGLYIVDGSGNIQTNNLCLTYDGTYWNYPPDTMAYYDNTSTTKYYAYYPYQSTITSSNVYPYGTDAVSFFCNLIPAWGLNLPIDQSTQAKYSAADLMVGDGSIGNLMMNATQSLKINMYHQMGMVEINMPYYYLSTDANYKYIPGLTWTNMIPYSMSDSTFHCIVSPMSSIRLTGQYISNLNSNSFKNISEVLSSNTGQYQTINIDGGAIGKSYTMKAGDYYLNDGCVIPSNSTSGYLLSKAIGVVFDTSTSATDQGYGWSHGYVMSLKSASMVCEWAGPNCQSTDESGATFKSFEYKNWQENDSVSIINNKDGYSETQAIDSVYSSSLENDHPAFYYALNFNNIEAYAAPKNKSNSGWYLPSVGQWYDIVTNLGGMPTTPTYTTKDGVEWNNSQSGNNGYTYICANNINNFLNVLSGYTNIKYDNFYNNNSNEYYWCSSEYSNTSSYCITFNPNGLFLNDSGIKSTSHYRVRSVLAF